MRRRARLAVMGCACAAALAVPSAATAAPLEVARASAADGTAYWITAAQRLRGARAPFAVLTQPSEVSPYGPDGVVSRARLRLPDRRNLLQVGSALACDGGISAVYGTVVRRARRVVARFDGGRRLRLKRHRAPRRWDFRGWVVGGVLPEAVDAVEVRAFDRRGKRVATARFAAPDACE